MTWQPRVVGALAPDALRVSVNPATAEVFAFTDIARAYSVPGTPAVGEDEAGSIALAAVEDDDAKVEFLDLAIAFDESGQQSLVWIVGVGSGRTGGPAVLVQVDAITGKPTIAGRG